MKKILIGVLIVATATLTSSADVLLFKQNNQGPDNVWSNAANWFSALHVPTSNDTARILGDTTWGPAFVTAPGAVAGTVELGLFGHGGVLTIDPTGTLEVFGTITVGQSLPAEGRSNLLVNNGELTVAGQGKVVQGVSYFENNGVANFNDTLNSFIMQPTGLGTVTNNGEFYAAGTVYASHSGNAVFVNETSGIFSNANTVIMGQDVAATGLLVNKGSFTAGSILYLNNGDQTLVNEGTMTLPKLTCQGDGSTATVTNSGTLAVAGDMIMAVAGTTIFNMEGGTVTVGGKLDLVPGGDGDAWTNNSVHINLNGGTIQANNVAFNGSKLANSTIDITEGVLVKLNGDVSATWNWVKNQGAFTAFGGAGDVIVEYDGTNTILRAELPSFPALSETALGPNLIANGGFEQVSDLVGTPISSQLYNITNSFGDYGPFNGLIAAVPGWEYYYDDPNGLSSRIGQPYLDEGGVDILDGTFYLDAFVDADDDHLNINSVMDFRHGMKQVDILNGETISADAVYQFAVNAAPPGYDAEAGTLTAKLTDGSGTPITGGILTGTLDTWTGLKGLTLSGDMLNDGQVNVMVDVVGTNAIPGYPDGTVDPVDGTLVSKVLIYEVSLNEVLSPQENDLNRDGIFDMADVDTANAYLDGSIDGGADAATRIANRIAQGMTPEEALADLNLTEFDVNGDGTFDAADIAALEALIPLIIERGAMNGSGHFEVEVSGLKIGTTYKLMKDDDLVTDPGFVEVDSQTAASGTETLTDTNAVAGQAFYKITD